MRKKDNYLIERELKSYNNIIDYLIKSYCLNPDEIITASKIENALKIEHSNILRPFLLELRKKNVLISIQIGIIKRVGLPLPFFCYTFLD